MLSLLLNVRHLTLEVLLHVLVATESQHRVPLSLHMVLPSVFIDDLAPELLLLLVLNLAEGTESGT